MGPALNAENRGTMESCDDLYVGSGDGDFWLVDT